MAKVSKVIVPKAGKLAAKAVTFKLISDTDALNKESKLIVSAIGNLDKRIQAYLLSEIAHIAQHHNTTRLNDFFKAISGKGARVTAMSAFVQKFGTVDFNEETKLFVESKGKALDMEGASATMWTELKPEAALRSFSLNEAVKRLIEQSLKLAATPREGVKDDIAPTTLDALLKLAESNGITYEAPKVKATEVVVTAEQKVPAGA